MLAIWTKHNEMGYMPNCHAPSKYRPVGNYTPNWAVTMKRNDVKQIFFIAEIKAPCHLYTYPPLSKPR